MNMQSPVVVETNRKKPAPAVSQHEAFEAELKRLPVTAHDFMRRWFEGGFAPDALTAIDELSSILQTRQLVVSTETEQRMLDSGDFIRKADLIGKMSELQSAFNRGQKIEAIKAARSITGQGLKDAKDYIEGFSTFPAYVQPEAEKPATYLVLAKSDNFDSEWHIHETFHSRDYFVGGAVQTARDYAENIADNRNFEVKLVKVIGETKSVFKMI